MSEKKRGRPRRLDLEKAEDAERKPWQSEQMSYSWEKRQNETRRDYELFKSYCKLGHDRTFARLASQVGLSVDTIKNTSQANGWQSRVSAYDDMVLKLRPSVQEITVENSREAQLVAGRILLDIGLKAVESKNPTLISIDQATKILQAGAEMERKALGEADLKVEISSNDMTRVQNLIEEMELDATDVEILDELDDYDPED